MGPTPVIAVFDVGKTNKKVLLLDENFQILNEQSVFLPQTQDEDGFPCEDLGALTRWISRSMTELSALRDFNIQAINFSAYGASFVNLDAAGNFATPLYNYLKPYPDDLWKKFNDSYGDDSFTLTTATPPLGSLNSGLQLYRLKYDQPHVFEKIKFSLHLPQYFHFLLAHQSFSDITSIGCHTGLWDFRANHYHRWVAKEEIALKLAPIANPQVAGHVEINNHRVAVGIGLHDSSAALIPYLKQFESDFALLSTGTWNITLNPFSTRPLTAEELAKDCLCYLDYQGKPVKASRLFAGHEHELAVNKISEFFHLAPSYHQSVKFDHSVVQRIRTENGPRTSSHSDPSLLIHGKTLSKDLSAFKSFEEAYHGFMIDLVQFQKNSTCLVVETGTKKLFVDGGFSQNLIFMELLKDAFPALEVYAATLPHASALGAAMVIHDQWAKNKLPGNVVGVTRFL